MRPSTTGVYALDPWFRTSKPLRDLTTLPQYFKANGYYTLTTGKIWHDAYPPRNERETGKEIDVWGFHGGHQDMPNLDNLIARHKGRYHIPAALCRPRMKVLDFPCGSGYGSEIFNRFGVYYEGMDCDPATIIYADLHYKGRFSVQDL